MKHEQNAQIVHDICQKNTLLLNFRGIFRL